MIDRIKEKLVYDIGKEEYTIKCWYLENTTESKGDALIRIQRNGKAVREFIMPAYKVWNIPAHIDDIIRSERESNLNGYEIALSTGI